MLKRLKTRLSPLFSCFFDKDIHGDNRKAQPPFIHMAHIPNIPNIWAAWNQHTYVDNMDKSRDRGDFSRKYSFFSP